LIILTAGLLGLTGLVHVSPVSHGAVGASATTSIHDQESLFGDEPAESARPSIGRALRVASVWLSLWLTPVIALLIFLGPQDVFSQIAVFFSKMAMVTFGGAYAVLAYVAQQAVQHYGWLKPAEMLDGLGMAETTPGPLIMVLQFVGFIAAYRDPGTLSPLAAGTLGGLLATWVTFTPCFLWIFVGAPFIERLRTISALNAALSAITAAVVGIVLNLALWFAIHTIFGATVPVRKWPLAFDAPVPSSLDPWALGLSIAAAVAIFRLRWGVIPTLASSCVAGVALHLVGAI
jgi:chromate transporter